MARLFNGTTQYLNAGAVLTATPLTMACWFLAANITAEHTLMNIGTAGSGNHRFGMFASGNVASDPVRINARTTASGIAVTSTGYSANVWQHACGVFASSVSRTVYLNGGGAGTDGTNLTPAGMDSTYIGALHGAAVGTFLSGRIAEAAIWNVALNASEVAALAAGVSPLRIRPNALVAYWPLFGVGSPEPDYSNGGFAMTLNNAPTQIDHAPVLPAFFRADWFGGGGAAATAYTMPAAQGSYVLSGQASNLLFNRKLSAVQGSYALNGQLASLIAARKLTALQGSYVLSGQAASLLSVISPPDERMFIVPFEDRNFEV